MDSLADYFSRDLNFKEDYDIIDEADQIIEETYQYMGLKKEIKTKTMSTSNFVLENGKAREKEISNLK